MDSFYHTSFLTFLKIGAFTLGGGYAMIPIIEAEVVDRHHWVGREEFVDLVAVSQTCPGVFAINISTFIGYRLRGLRGALCTTLGTALPSFLMILLVAMAFHSLMDIAWVAAMFAGIRPAVVALIAAPTFRMARTARITLTNGWIPLASALLIWLLGVNPIYILIAAAFAGWLWGRLLAPEDL